MCKYSAELWAEARTTYVDSDSVSHKEIASEFDINVLAIHDRAAPKRENWTKLRKDRQRELKRAERRAIEHKADVNVEAQVEARAEYKRVARKIMERAEKYLESIGDEDLNPDKLTKIASTVERCQNIEWTSMGIQRVLDGDLADRAARVVFVPVAAEPEQGDQPGEPSND